MKYLKKFENFDFSTGRIPADDEQPEVSDICKTCGCNCTTDECTCEDCDCEACCAKCCDEDEVAPADTYADYRRFGAKKPIMTRPTVGDEVVDFNEKKKFNFEKKKSDKKEDKEDKKEDKKETKGLSASQKKLPAGLQKAILAKKK